MSIPNRFKELLEKLMAHAEANKDEELKAIVASFETSDEGDDNGGNHPEPPDVP